MKKPQPKAEVAIRCFNSSNRHIVFDATIDAADDFKDFGWLTKSSHYDLFVDARYDFDEVLRYIEDYGGLSTSP